MTVHRQQFRNEHIITCQIGLAKAAWLVFCLLVVPDCGNTRCVACFTVLQYPLLIHPMKSYTISWWVAHQGTMHLYPKSATILSTVSNPAPGSRHAPDSRWSQLACSPTSSPTCRFVYRTCRGSPDVQPRNPQHTRSLLIWITKGPRPFRQVHRQQEELSIET